MLKIHVLKALRDNFIYALSSGNLCAVIDPGEAAPVVDFLSDKGLSLKYILFTHHHWDHIDGAPELVRLTTCKVLASKPDVDRVSVPAKPLTEGPNYELFGEPFQILEVPGHTLGQIAYYFPRMAALFAGDTLFSAGCGRLFEGTADMMFTSLQKLKALPTETLVYFGHEYTLRNLDFVAAFNGADRLILGRYKQKCLDRIENGLSTTPTTLAQELTVNPFLKARNTAEFAKWRRLRDDW
jgi:hydroxyacylglutathione hydrolase